MKRRKHASCITNDFENDNVRRTKRASAAALRAVAAQVTLAAVCGQPVAHQIQALAVLTS